MTEDWQLLIKLLPSNWQELAVTSKALKGLRKDKSAESLLRVLLLHLGCGYSLRETVVRARRANLSDFSDVALLKRLKKSKDWLYVLCLALFRERGLCLEPSSNFQVRLFDATTVKEPGQTGSLWRVHYSVQVPSLNCDYFKLTETQGEGTGESFEQFPVQRGDYLIADRGYCSAEGIHYVAREKAYVTVRINPRGIRLLTSQRKKFALLEQLERITKVNAIKSWQVIIPDRDNKHYLGGRLCVIRKSESAIRRAHQQILRRAHKKGQKLRPETLVYAKYVILFTTFPEIEFSDAEVLEWYRIRWQVELVFKRFKQIAQLGHLPKYDDESSKAWLYGKLFVALITEKLIEYASSISPWGYCLAEPSHTKPVA
jgi:hypothetical protein